MDTLNNSRAQTDIGVYNATISQVLKTIPVEIKAQIFDRFAEDLGLCFTQGGFMRTENMNETALAVVTGGQVVQTTGYDVLAKMKHKTESKTTGTRISYKQKQAKWLKHTAQVHLSRAKEEAEFFFITVSLNRTDGSTEAVFYLIHRSRLLNKQGKLRSVIDFGYGENASINTNDEFYPYMFRSLEELCERFENMPVLEIVDIFK